MVEQMEKSQYMVKGCFKHLNQYKRLRALQETEKERGNTELELRHELARYKVIDQLELALRGLQSELRKDNE